MSTETASRDRASAAKVPPAGRLSRMRMPAVPDPGVAFRQPRSSLISRPITALGRVGREACRGQVSGGFRRALVADPFDVCPADTLPTCGRLPPAVKEDHRRYAAWDSSADMAGLCRSSVYNDIRFQFPRRRLIGGSHHPARTAPGSPHIHHDRQAGAFHVPPEYCAIHIVRVTGEQLLPALSAFRGRRRTRRCQPVHAAALAADDQSLAHHGFSFGLRRT